MIERFCVFHYLCLVERREKSCVFLCLVENKNEKMGKCNLNECIIMPLLHNMGIVK
jgi:hypothetical protein